MNGHKGFSSMFQEGRLTLGLNIPIEAHGSNVPTLEHQIERAQLAEAAGFSCLWFQDVVLEDPTFEDPATGQILDSLTYLTYLGAHTSTINLGTAAVVTPLRHPLRLAKEVASIERLFPERLMLGISSGDRRKDFEGLNVPIMERGRLFREAFDYFNDVISEEFPSVESPMGKIDKSNLVPKPTSRIPLLMTGYCQQTFDWIAEHGDGWMFYPQPPEKQKEVINSYREKAAAFHPEVFRPFIMPLPIQLSEDKDAPLSKIPAGYRGGRQAITDILREYRDIGVNHIMFNLSKSERPVEEVIDEFKEFIIPSLRKDKEV
ncbi:TIGR03571 family LLM class oxidoreductase [Salimicrobium halophilum]|uniref:Luciferase-type oxidoreductase, BA3436 family n=1 Tax=Salimicrobium halophilum TaxID=86666 RepID=A0A1G8U6T8_9BACI|nr:TIGR03571 family LLM class oxidoreductase [Salimicrobium halophilum]SDJ49334.1 luciferase-type oxidoreductase, BA3436 family [Salimicrobium halophilum]